MGWIAFIIIGSMLVITIAHIIGDLDMDIPIDKEDIFSYVCSLSKLIGIKSKYISMVPLIKLSDISSAFLKLFILYI